MEERLKETIHREISNIPAEHLQKVNQNLFRWCEECLRVEEQHFQHLLQTVNKGKNFPSFQILSACSVIGKIRLRFATGDGPIAVKHRAVNTSSSLKTLCINLDIHVIANQSILKYFTGLVEIIQKYHSEYLVRTQTRNHPFFFFSPSLEECKLLFLYHHCRFH
jgi:hypothetical protein